MAAGRAERILLIVASGFVALVAITIVTTPRAQTPPHAATVDSSLGTPAPETPASATQQGAPLPDDSPVSSISPSAEPPVNRDTADERARIQNGAPGTYLVYMASLESGKLYRWPDRRIDALRVWVEPSSTVAGWSDNYAQVARAAFDEWQRAGSPLRFTFTLDPAENDIRVHWIDHFPLSDGRRIGVTHRSDDDAGWVVSAQIEVALHDSAGTMLTPAEVAGVIRHEVGHALGLGHANDPHAMMYPVEGVTEISPVDLATLRLLYTLPPGPIPTP